MCSSCLRSLLSAAGELCPVIKAARAAALSHEQPGRRGSGLTGGPTIPPYPGLKQRQTSHNDLTLLGSSSSASQPVPARAHPAGHAGGDGSSSGVGPGFGSPLSSMDGAASLAQHGSRGSGLSGLPRQPQQQPRGGGGSGLLQLQPRGSSGSSSSLGEDEDGAAAAVVPPSWQRQQRQRVEPKLFVLGNGSGSPCLDLSRVPAALADATVGVDLLVSRGWQCGGTSASLVQP